MLSLYHNAPLRKYYVCDCNPVPISTFLDSALENIFTINIIVKDSLKIEAALSTTTGPITGFFVHI